jgi:hypothetical protein
MELKRISAVWVNIITRFTEQIESLAKSYFDDPEEAVAPEVGGELPPT